MMLGLLQRRVLWFCCYKSRKQKATLYPYSNSSSTHALPNSLQHHGCQLAMTPNFCHYQLSLPMLSIYLSRYIVYVILTLIKSSLYGNHGQMHVALMIRDIQSWTMGIGYDEYNTIFLILKIQRKILLYIIILNHTFYSCLVLLSIATGTNKHAKIFKLHDTT